MARDPRDIIIRPVVSEKSYASMDANIFTFVVDRGANKIQIRQAIEAIYPDVKVAKVNTLNRQGKLVRSRRIRGAVGKKPDTKRAIVTLREGTIDIFGS
jgi:large subunit ribosomal protein L23